jgi:predicted dehydrogenase
MSPTPTLGAGIVGFGFIGKVHAYGYQNIPLFYDPAPARVRLVGVCTSRPETAAKAAEQGSFEFGTTRFEDLLEREDIQLINICTPNHLHREQVIAALEAGKHVYCDKPLTVTAQDAREIAAAVAAHPGQVHGMAFHMRFIPAMLRARQLVAEGFLGQVYHFRACYLHAGYTDPDRPLSWRLTGEAGGGALSDLGSHIVDVMGYLLGDYEAVRSTTETYVKERPAAKGSEEKVAVEVDDYVALQARMRCGALGFIEASRFATGAHDGMSFEVYGELGSLRFNMMDPNYLYVYDAREPEADLGGRRGWTQVECLQRYPKPSVLPSPKLPVGWMRFHLHSQFDFVSAVVAGKPGAANLLDGIRAQMADEAIRRSARSGAWETVEG